MLLPVVSHAEKSVVVCSRICIAIPFQVIAAAAPLRHIHRSFDRGCAAPPIPPKSLLVGNGGSDQRPAVSLVSVRAGVTSKSKVLFSLLETLACGAAPVLGVVTGSQSICEACAGDCLILIVAQANKQKTMAQTKRTREGEEKGHEYTKAKKKKKQMRAVIRQPGGATSTPRVVGKEASPGAGRGENEAHVSVIPSSSPGGEDEGEDSAEGDGEPRGDRGGGRR